MEERDKDVWRKDDNHKEALNISFVHSHCEQAEHFTIYLITTSHIILQNSPNSRSS